MKSIHTTQKLETVKENQFQNKCGNGVAESAENACNCPKDVDINLPRSEGGCSGNKGEYLEYYCTKDNTCQTKVTDAVDKKTKLLSFSNGNDYTLSAQVTYNSPFIIGEHEFEVEVELNKIQSTDTRKIKDLTIEGLYIITNENEIIASKELSKKFTTPGEKLKIVVEHDSDLFKLKDFSKTMRSVNLQVSLSYSVDYYTMQTGGNYTFQRSDPQSVKPRQLLENTLLVIDPTKETETEVVDTGWGSVS